MTYFNDDDAQNTPIKELLKKHGNGKSKNPVVQNTIIPKTTKVPWRIDLNQRNNQNFHTNFDKSKVTVLPPDPVKTTFERYHYEDYMRPLPFVPVDYLGTAGLDPRDAQKLNAEMLRSTIQLQRLHEMNQERFSFMIARDEYNRQNTPSIFRTADGELIPIPNRNRPNFYELEQAFIIDFALVKVRSKYSGKWSFMIRSKDDNRHVPISESQLREEYNFFLDEHLPEDDLSSQAVLEKSYQHVKRHIPKLQDSNLRILTETDVMFKDGIFNVETRVFTPVSATEKNQYFNIFSIELSFNNGQDVPPDVFDSFLKLILNNNQDSVKLVYQMIGAILTPTSTLKKCFLLQGVHDSGKTTLVNFIKELMPIDDTIDLPNISGLTSDDLIKTATPIRLINVSELGTNKLSSKQIVNIKAFADGSRDTPGSSSFKLIMTTNHKITTGEGDMVEPAIKNRLLVIPFPVSIDFSKADPRIQSLNDVYFQKELRGIILKALIAYSEVLNNNGQFCANYEVNAVVDPPMENTDGLNPKEREVLYNGIGQPMIPYNALNEIFQTAFIITKEVNPAMTTKVVMNTVNQVRAGLLQNEASTGRKLQEFFGEALKTSRINGNTCYNLEFNIPSDTPKNKN